jgi:hypothetical protein
VSKLSTANAQNGGCLFTLRSKKNTRAQKKRISTIYVKRAGTEE